MSPFKAISFLSLHASFPSLFDLVEKKTVITNRGGGLERLCPKQRTPLLPVFHLGEASAVSLIMLAILLIFTGIYIRLAMRSEPT
jgi:ABC-type sugar transport system permease subunit